MLFFAAVMSVIACGKESEPEPVPDVAGNVPVTLSVAGIDAELSSETSTFYVTLPGETDFSSVDLAFETESDRKSVV